MMGNPNLSRILRSITLPFGRLVPLGFWAWDCHPLIIRGALLRLKDPGSLLSQGAQHNTENGVGRVDSHATDAQMMLDIFIQGHC